MRKQSSWLLLFSLVVVPATLTADTVIEQIIARVNGQVITSSEYQREKERVKQEAQANPDRAAESEKDVLRGLIDTQLLLDKGKDLGITADTEVIKKLDEMRKQMNLETMEDLEKAAVAQGISFEDFKQNLRNQIITQQVISREVGSRIVLDKADEQKFYDEHKAELMQPEEIRLSEILVSTQKKDGSAPTDAELAAAKAKADDLLSQIRQGASFEEVAKKNSDDPTAAQGGDLGYFERGKMSKELEDKTFAMKAGEVSDVIRSKQGFIILKVSEHTAGGVPPLKEVEPRIQEAIYMQKMQPVLRAYLLKLREDAFIDIKPGYVDSGASPNQTKPVETTVKDVNAKQLKKKKKMLLF